ncbi:hypothetical protein GRF59_15380 [Paenibacillus sp. HJL G12]|uniref:Tetratricopeptide repeat protein n=1 Tax=Paenibacillus dendrobii TaxID=2691084 RepID=A0A7X3LJ46_9BACL|nr:hypothetical protein [Paenibacillus dendrobii]MWV45004.1 hypothetical protein [Paenibacillus dendrobii]
MNNDHFAFPLKSQPESSSLHFKSALWYRSRGMLDEAVSCFEQALSFAKSQNNGNAEPNFDETLCWLEYGKLLRSLELNRQAAAAFQHCLIQNRYAREALVEIGMMHSQAGMNDSEIAHQLANLASESMPNTEIIVAESLWTLGAYTAAAEIYASCLDERSYSESNLVHYILCLIYINQFNEALALLSRKAVHQEHVLLMTAQHLIRTTEVIYVCKWCLHGMKGGAALPVLSRYEALETAKTAIALGKIDEALTILSSPTTHEYNELIYTMYKQGYRELAALRISEMEHLPLHERNQISLELCFIAAEIQYDIGNYEEAASIFEIIYLTDPNHSCARFGAASSYLQQTRKSLNARLEGIIVGSEMYIKIEQYLNNISRALQILHITKWHTEWTPAQQRNQLATTTVMFH